MRLLPLIKDSLIWLNLTRDDRRLLGFLRILYEGVADWSSTVTTLKKDWLDVKVSRRLEELRLGGCSFWYLGTTTTDSTSKLLSSWRRHALSVHQTTLGAGNSIRYWQLFFIVSINLSYDIPLNHECLCGKDSNFLPFSISLCPTWKDY